MTDPAPLDTLVSRTLATAARVRARHPLEPDDLDEPDELDEVRALGSTDLWLQRWASRIPSRFAWAQLADVAVEHPEVYDDVAEWSADPRGRNLVLLGPVGTGKSHTAVAACRAACQAGLSVQFLPVDEMLDLLRPGGPESTLYDLAGFDRLIIDDLGAERQTEWTADRTFAVVNRRWLEERPTIVTSNLDPNGMQDTLGPRLYSRLVGNDAVVIRLSGADRRRAR